MSIKSSQIIINDLLVSYIQNEKNKTDNTVVFLHGWQAQANTWNPVLNILDSRSIGFYALDLPGFGNSQAPRQAFEVSDYADIVKVFLQKLEIKKAIIVGHSFGGRVGIKLAAAHPELISKLVLVDSAGFASKTLFSKTKIASAKIVRPFFGLPGLRRLKKYGYKVIGATDYAESGKLKDTFVKVISEDLTEYLKQINCPTLLLWGSEDSETPVEFGNRMKNLIQNSSLIIFEKAGHFCFLDKPEEFSSNLISFL